LDETVPYVKKVIMNDIFACMELSKQSYIDVANMPYKRLEDYLKWKAELEDEKQKKFAEESGKIKLGKTFK